MVRQSVSKSGGGEPRGGKGILIQEDRTGALSTLNNQYVLASEPILLESNQNHATIQTNGISTTLPASMGMGGGYIPMVCAGFKHKAGSGAGGIGYEPETAPTLSAEQQSAVLAAGVLPFDTTQITSPQNGCHPNYGDPCHPLAAGAHPPAVCIGNGQLNQITMAKIANTLSTVHDQQAVMVAHSLRASSSDPHREDAATYPITYSCVRRLTPLECERLQGYPDGWTDIGDWVDSKGKRHKVADRPRYKALGNSIALPFWFWLLRRISAQYERVAYLGSLFDGIGGFPLCWERCNGKGTARWASEIEEFPMAVTRYHFGEG